jgi:GIY-YIG catalytic domain
MTMASLQVRPSFHDYAGQLDALFERLKSAAAKPLSDLTQFPQLGGCYVLMENDIRLYVGIAKNLRQRMRNHVSGRAEQSAFAFKLAREVTGHQPTYRKTGSRKDLVKNNAEFSNAMRNTTERVRKMSAQFVVIEDAALRYLFEFFAAHSLNTRYNDFNTH